jgi:hypothetical protein
MNFWRRQKRISGYVNPRTGEFVFTTKDKRNYIDRGNIMEKEVENSQVEQLENTVYLKHREERVKKVKEFVKPRISSLVFITFLKFPLLVMAKENGTPPQNHTPQNGEDSSTGTLLLLSNFCTLAYQLWKRAKLPNMSFSEFLGKCVEAIFTIASDKGTCPAPPAGGPKPGGPPPAFLNSLKSSPYAMGGSILLITFLFVSASLNSKEKEEKK